MAGAGVSASESDATDASGRFVGDDGCGASHTRVANLSKTASESLVAELVSIFLVSYVMPSPAGEELP